MHRSVSDAMGFWIASGQQCREIDRRVAWEDGDGIAIRPVVHHLLDVGKFALPGPFVDGEQVWVRAQSVRDEPVELQGIAPPSSLLSRDLTVRAAVGHPCSSLPI